MQCDGLPHMARREGQIRGELSEMEVTVELLKNGCRVSDTIGHAHPYDLIADFEGRILKIQVKTAKHRGRRKYDIVLPQPEKYTKESVDIFAGYTREEDSVFFFPYSEVNGKRASVTFTPPEDMGSEANRQRANLARDYTFQAVLERL